MTAAELDALAAMLEKLEVAGKGPPWFFEYGAGGHGGLTRIDDGRHDGLFAFATENPEAELLVAAVNALPRLIEAARESIRLVFGLHEWKVEAGEMRAERDALKAKLAAFIEIARATRCCDRLTIDVPPDSIQARISYCPTHGRHTRSETEWGLLAAEKIRERS